MEISKKDIENVSVIAVSGRVDSISSNKLGMVISEAIEKNQRVIIDLAETEYICSSGLRVLLDGLKKLQAKKGEMRLISLQPVVRDVFNISGLSNLFSIHGNLKGALESFAPSNKG